MSINSEIKLRTADSSTAKRSFRDNSCPLGNNSDGRGSVKLFILNFFIAAARINMSFGN